MDIKNIKNMKNRRNGDRRYVDMSVTKQLGDDSFDCWITDISPSGVRLSRRGGRDRSQKVCTLELHLAPGAIYTEIAAKRVWMNDDFEAYEFISPSFAQQNILERIAGNF